MLTEITTVRAPSEVLAGCGTVAVSACEAGRAANLDSVLRRPGDPPAAASRLAYRRRHRGVAGAAAGWTSRW
ncbi:MAG: hypothetical protein AAFX58_12820 [Pseudomonadota bacterium]